MAAIEVKNFSYKYPDGTVALQDIDLSIEHGEKVVLIGPNGAGKSTLLLALAGFLTGTGQIIIDGIEVNKKNNKKLRSIIGSCMENPDDQLFMPTVFDDIAFGPLNMSLDAETIRQKVFDALRTVGLEKHAEKAPHHLSAGQKRAAAIASILSMSPKIITFDEPDGSLDPRNRTKIARILKSLSQTLVIATCNMNFAYSIADRVVLINNKKVITQGPKEKLMLDEKLMADHGLELPVV